MGILELLIYAIQGVWKKIFELLSQDSDNEYAMIDSSIVRAHQHSAGAKKKIGSNPCSYDKDLYKARHLIENFFAKLKQYRAIDTRYDKTTLNFLGAIHLIAAAIWLN